MTWWSGLFATAAVLLLFGGPVVAVGLFRPQRARAVKHAELESEVVVQRHVTELAIYHPEIRKQPRVDRHPFYLAPPLAVLAYAVCLFAGAPLTSNVAAMSMLMRHTMAACFVIGAALMLTGAALGVRFAGRWTIAPRVRHHATAPMLGDDVSLPYRLGSAGMFALAISMGIYSLTSFQSTTGSLGGWLTGLLAIAAALTILWLFTRTRDFERNEATLLAEVQARIERDTNDLG